MWKYGQNRSLSWNNLPQKEIGIGSKLEQKIISQVSVSLRGCFDLFMKQSKDQNA